MPADKGSQTTAQTLSDAISEAQHIVQVAEERARELKEEAEQQRAEAREQGYAEGVLEGRRAVADTAVRLIEESSQVGARLAEEAAKLAIAICSSVVAEQVRLKPDTVKDIALRALQESVVGESATLIVNPKDKKSLEECADQLRRVTGGAKLQVETDSSLTRGGCVVRTEFGEVDATIESLLAALEARLGVESK